MDLTPLLPQGRQMIESYGPGRFRVAGVVYETALLVMPTQTLVWDVGDFNQMTPESFAPLFATPLDVLLLGCGAKAAFVAPALRQALKARGIVVEAMESGGACRTYNVLMMEGRSVAAALLPLPK